MKIEIVFALLLFSGALNYVLGRRFSFEKRRADRLEKSFNVLSMTSCQKIVRTVIRDKGLIANPQVKNHISVHLTKQVKFFLGHETDISYKDIILNFRKILKTCMSATRIHNTKTEEFLQLSILNALVEMRPFLTRQLSLFLNTDRTLDEFDFLIKPSTSEPNHGPLQLKNFFAPLFWDAKMHEKVYLLVEVQMEKEEDTERLQFFSIFLKNAPTIEQSRLRSSLGRKISQSMASA